MRKSAPETSKLANNSRGRYQDTEELPVLRTNFPVLLN